MTHIYMYEIPYINDPQKVNGRLTKSAGGVYGRIISTTVERGKPGKTVRISFSQEEGNNDTRSITYAVRIITMKFISI